MTVHYVTLMVAILGGLAVIGGAIWRVGSAVFSLMYEVRLGSWRLDRIERHLGVDEPAPPLLVPPMPVPRRRRPGRRVAPAVNGHVPGQPLRGRTP